MILNHTQHRKYIFPINSFDLLSMSGLGQSKKPRARGSTLATVASSTTTENLDIAKRDKLEKETEIKCNEDDCVPQVADGVWGIESDDDILQM